MKFKGTWIFSLVVIFAVAVAVWDYQRQQASHAEKELAAQLIRDFDMNQVANFEFKGNAGSFKAENVGGEWKITEPIQDTGDYQSLEGLLLGLAEQNMEQVEVEAEPNWPQYGLDQPEAVLDVTMQDGSSIKIEVGSKRAYNDGYYIRKNSSSELYLGSTTWTSYLSKTANDMRNRELYNGPSDYNFLEIIEAKKKLTFQSIDGAWSSPQNKGILIDESALYDYINLLRHLRADAIVSDFANSAARKLYNINKPAMTVVIEERAEADSKKWKIEFSKEKNNEVFVSVGEDRPVYRIQARKMDSLKKNFSHFRDKAYPFAIDHTRIPAFRIKRTMDKRERFFQKNGGKWVLPTEEPHMKINETAITNMFNDFRGLKVKEFIEGKAAKEDLRGKYGLVILNAVGDIYFEMFWSDVEKVKEDSRVKVWTTLSNEAFWVDAAEFKSFESRNLLVPDTATKEQKEEK